MDLYLLDEDFAVIAGPEDSFTSVIIRERYYGGGTFELHLPTGLSEAFLTAVSGDGAKYVRSGEGEKSLTHGHFCGIIEYIAVGVDGKGEVTVSGHLLTRLAWRKIMSGRGSRTGSVTDVVTEAVGDFLPECEIGEEQAEISDIVTLDYSYDNLGERLSSLLRSYGASFAIELDAQRGVPVFSVVKGRQTGAVFSVSCGNIADCEAEWDSSDGADRIYAQGKDGTVVVCGNGTTERAVKFDLSPTDFASRAEYEAALGRRGNEELAACVPKLSVEADIIPDTLPEYGADVFLGDEVSVEPGLTFGAVSARIVSADVVEENGGRRVIPHFASEE